MGLGYLFPKSHVACLNYYYGFQVNRLRNAYIRVSLKPIRLEKCGNDQPASSRRVFPKNRCRSGLLHDENCEYFGGYCCSTTATCLCHGHNKKC